MKVSSENISQHLVVMGYSAKAGTITDKTTGEPVDVVFINGLGSINAYLNLSDDPKKFGLKVFGNLQQGYAPVVLDATGHVVRETVDVDGETVTRAMRGQPLDATALKAKNNEISLTARREITGAVLAAYMLELGGGDIELLREGFRLQKWERAGSRPAMDGSDGDTSTDVESATSFAKAASADNAPKPASRIKRAQGPAVS